MCFFSLITICLNPGEKLRKSLESALRQTEGDFEVVIKDGGSRDGSLETIKDILADPRFKLYEEKDHGIYDGMNQAVAHAQGKYAFFLNCGDLLYDEKVLERVRATIEKHARETAQGKRTDDFPMRPLILYGNVYNQKTKAWITPAPRITGFTCYRNIPCHQACFYDVRLCRQKPFETKYKIRGDYEHFLWCFYRGDAETCYLDAPVAEYEGGGYSETKENLKRSRDEHREITEKYMGKAELLKYRMLMALSLSTLRTWLAESPVSSAVYQRMVRRFYRGR